MWCLRIEEGIAELLVFVIETSCARGGNSPEERWRRDKILFGALGWKDRWRREIHGK